MAAARIALLLIQPFVFTFAALQAGEWPHEGELPQGAIARFVASKSELKGSSVVTFSPDGTILAVAGIKQELWDVQKKEKFFEFFGTGKAQFTIDNKYVTSVVYGHDYHIQWYDLPGKKEMPRLEGHDCEVTEIAMSSDGKYLASMTYRNESPVFIWNLETQKRVKSLSISKDAQVKFTIAPDGRHLLLARDKLAVYQLPDLNLAQEVDWPKGLKGRVYRLSVHADRRRVNFFTYEGEIFDWDWVSKEMSKVKVLPKSAKAGLTFGIEWSNDGRLIFAPWSRDNIVAYEAVSLKPICSFPGIGFEPYSIALHPGGQLLAAGYEGHAVVLWDVDKVVYKDDPLANEATPEVLNGLYTLLGGDDVESAYSAIKSLAKHGAASIALFKSNLKLPSKNMSRIDMLAKNLRAPAAHVRKASLEELARFGHQAGNALADALRDKLADDTRAATEEQLGKLEKAALSEELSAEVLKQVRIIYTLERIKTPEATAFLKLIAMQTPLPRVWLEANRALGRSAPK